MLLASLVPVHAEVGKSVAARTESEPHPAASLVPVVMPTKLIIPGGTGLEQLSAAGHVKVTDAKLSFQSGATLIQVAANTVGKVEIEPAGDSFDADGFTRMVFELKNLGAAEVKYELRLEDPKVSSNTGYIFFTGWMNPGQAKNGSVYFPRSKAVLANYPELKVFAGMRAKPGGLVFEDCNIDPAKIRKVQITIHTSSQEARLSVGNVYASHPPVPPLLRANPERYFPFIDSYGQFIHENWPGKVTSDDQLKEATRLEQKDLADHPPAADRSQFGGWTKGPRLEATGFFRTEKREGKWWLVDPEGYLFWSHGVTCVGPGGADTTVEGHEKFFSGLPKPESPLAQFYAKGGSIFMFTQSNLFRKFGPDWVKTQQLLTIDRLKSWGMNTMGNWSNPGFTSHRKVPYVAAVEYKCDTVTWRKFPDVFSPSFRANLREAIEKKSDTFNDPWCIGYFIDNELKFGAPMKVVGDIAMELPTAPAKIAWVADLKKAYPDIGEFNRAAGTQFSDWDAVLANRGAIGMDGLQDAANAFYNKMCSTYFATCREEQKRVAPHQLYLGSRFLQNVPPEPVAVAAEYCDVVSYNVYEFNVSSRGVAGKDKPFIVGEFHFGALDRGMFGPGNRWASDQQDRAGLYRDYVTSALENPLCVGTHWFQYNSQAFTGRPDGENFQVGLLDITGNPYPELRDAIRSVGTTMYQTRVAAAKTTSNQ